MLGLGKPCDVAVGILERDELATARNGIGSLNRRFQPRLATSAPVRRHPLTPIEAPIFLGRPVALIAPFLEIGVRALRQEHLPRLFEIGAGLVEGGRGAVCAFQPG